MRCSIVGERQSPGMALSVQEVSLPVLLHRLPREPAALRRLPIFCRPAAANSQRGSRRGDSTAPIRHLGQEILKGEVSLYH
jgi:hypothetical protein